MYPIDTSHPSPNHSPRDGAAISLVVLHATVGSFVAARTWLTDPASRVSSHYLIRKDGLTARLVDEADAAWHAGLSAWRGMSATEIQRSSIGIELENANDGTDPYPGAQIAALTDLLRDILTRHHLTPDAVVTHAQIAIPPNRKSDPAGLDLTALRAALRPPDPFAAWGPIGHPSGAQAGWAVPRLWLQHRALGACVRAEEYLTPNLSVTVFVGGFVWYWKPKDRAIVEFF